MAIIRKKPVEGGETNGSGSGGTPRLGRGLDSLSRDNAADTGKKTLVVPRGPYVQDVGTSASKGQASPGKRSLPGSGGRVVVRTDELPGKPIRSARSARRGTTVLIRTERDPKRKRYRIAEHIPARSATGGQDRPIVIKPRGTK